MAENFSLRRAAEPLLRMARPHYGARANAREALNDIRADRAVAGAAVNRARTRGGRTLAANAGRHRAP